MKKGRSILFILSALYVIAAALSLRNVAERGAKSEEPAASVEEGRVFCWDEAGKTYERISGPAIAAASVLGMDQAADLDGDGLRETYDLSGGVLTVREGSETVWHSEASWRIDSFMLADVNNDGVIDLNLSLWKPGNFGEFMPFWVAENDMSIRNHFFIFDYEDDRMRPVWQSSNLAVPNCHFLIADTDNDGKNELVVLEGDYADPVCRGTYLAVWKWGEWGFWNEWRSQKGEFSGLKVVKAGAGGGSCFMGE